MFTPQQVLISNYADKDAKNVDYAHANDDKQDIGVQDVEEHMEPDPAVAKYAGREKTGVRPD